MTVPDRAAGQAVGRVVVRVKRLDGQEDLPLPSLASAQAAGWDLPAGVREPFELEPGARALVPCGIALEIPDGFEGQVRPRSGLALRHGVTVLNAPGTIDADYRGEVGVILANFGDRPFTVARGDRIAQLVIAPLARGVAFEIAEALASTERGSGGFGSTGTD